MESIQRPAYTKLADIYDTVMEEVDYDLWADYIDALILQHHPNPESIIELACGTGSLALSLDELECYDIMGTDKSPQMIEKAREKNRELHCDVEFEVMDFLDIELDRQFDIAVSVFDSVNYLHSTDKVKQFLEESKKVINDGGLLIYDFTTPQNSIQAIEYLDKEEGFTENNFRFYRRSTYDKEKRIHTNDFTIEKLGEDNETVIDRYREVHRQRAYTFQEMLDIIDQTAYNIVACYDDFEFEEADENSLRITMILK